MDLSLTSKHGANKRFERKAATMMMMMVIRIYLISKLIKHYQTLSLSISLAFPLVLASFELFSFVFLFPFFRGKPGFLFSPRGTMWGFWGVVVLFYLRPYFNPARPGLLPPFQPSATSVALVGWWSGYYLCNRHLS